MVITKSYIDEHGTEIAAQQEPRAQAFAPYTAAQLRRIAVDYMYQMAKVVWTSSKRIDYSFNNEALVYEAGQTYLGVLYNNCRNGFEAFCKALDENGVYQLEDIGWDTAPGNSCATSIKHAWQMICPDVEYLYSINMMPYYAETAVVAVGNIDWKLYDGKNTTESILKNTEKDTILEAYAQTLPGDGFMRYLEKGGHALMATLPPEVVRDAQGKIDPENSFVFLTDQNNRIHNRRELPSSWEVDRKISFEKSYTDGWLPVTVKELRQGNAPVPVFEVCKVPTGAALGAGQRITAAVKCNYCIMTLRAELHEGNAEGKLLQAHEQHPYIREFSLECLSEALKLDALPEGAYCLTVEARVGLGSARLFEVCFCR